ncbi:phosphomannomutase/phosphoglucomutase [Candidatus Uhrbacteria bacterium CG_4_9_14_3_um_filter_50_9]|uniref:Phosphomannomutase/phosphoglucomutase n=1 Tax=Candidatus Uhrbacteria bacterium CG_4_9_14_3_um_filter_50_9 TaxID=1975035 RepID=A0A2M7XB99_9BACT|nr:MAG: phosphomannomutase/phosphoglucomutase [Candidatus Uhrbacteria bacterium CG_4_9_14_3_um_filter_50_9]
MDFPRKIFKAYDIRGLVEEEITNELAEKIGQAYATLRQGEVGADKRHTVAVGRDMRDSSPIYQQHLMNGLMRMGVDVVDIGLVSTPAFYFGVGHLGADGGIMVSASHNPAEYNGFKLTREQAIPVSGDTGIETIADLIEQNTFVDAPQKGRVRVAEGIPQAAAQAERLFAGGDPVKTFKIVADTGNGMGAQFLDELFGFLDTDVTRMYWELDGTFPNHESNPFKPENIVDLQKTVVELGADVGIATDGDGDRIFFVDDKGQLVTPAVLRGLLAQIALRDHPGATICYDIRPGKITEDMIVEAGGKPSVTRVGHSLIKEQMRKEGAVFGGESSGHFFYAFETGVYEGPVTVAMQMLQEMTRQGKPLSEIVEPLERYVHSGEINFTVEDKEGMMNKIKQHFREGTLSELDGITLTYQDFWFNVRPSNTESTLRLNLEAVDRATMEAKRDEVIALIKAGV